MSASADDDEGGLRESLAGSAYALGWSAVRRMPERMAQGAFRRIADQSFARGGAGVQMLESNLRRVVGPTVDEADLHRLTQAGMRSYMRYWCEVFRLPGWTPEMVHERVVMHDVENLVDAVAAGATVVALPHCANWDSVGAWVAQSITPFTTVAERLRPESLYDRFVEYRESLGMEVLPLTGGENVFLALVRRARDGRLVCLPADRDLTASGVEVDFFGATARMPGGPAALAHATGATLLTAALWYDGPRMHVRLSPPVALSTSTDRKLRVVETTQRVATAFEAGIAAHPQDWHMLQPLWVDDVDRLRSVDRDADEDSDEGEVAS